MKLNPASLIVVATVVVGSIAATGSQGKTGGKAPPHGENLYMANCEACHMIGKNVIKPEKEIVSSSKLSNEAVFREFLKEKHGYMPPFPQIAAQDKDIRALYKYVRKLKLQSWEYEQTSPEMGHDPETVDRPNQSEPDTQE